MDLLFGEDVLIDWTQPLYLNFTHVRIMERLEDFYADKGVVDKLYGDVHVKDAVEEDDSTEVLVYQFDFHISNNVELQNVRNYVITRVVQECFVALLTQITNFKLLI